MPRGPTPERDGFVEAFALIAKPTAEALHVPVLPGAARSDEERADTSPSEPTPKRVGDELGTVVRTDVNRNPESNWLPAPKEPFYMLMRMYLPDIEVLNGQYEIPGVVRGK
jgi:hypothetical protein